jgi:hypothetical protein
VRAWRRHRRKADGRRGRYIVDGGDARDMLEVAFVFLVVIMLLIVGYTGWQRGVVRTVGHFEWEEDEARGDSGPERSYG